MSKPWRLTKQAEQSLIDIANWTFDTFGPRQAEAYQVDLIDTCKAIADGSAQTRDCGALIGEPDTSQLRFARAGGHFVVFTEVNAEVIIVDLLHASSDLPRQLSRLKD